MVFGLAAEAAVCISAATSPELKFVTGGGGGEESALPVVPPQLVRESAKKSSRIEDNAGNGI